MCGGGRAEPVLRAKPDHVTTAACAWTMAKGNPYNKDIIRWMESRKSDARNLPVARDAPVQDREPDPAGGFVSGASISIRSGAQPSPMKPDG